MAGHNKWSKVKHIKAKEDAKKGKAFTKIGRDIAVAVRASGTDPVTNAALRLALQKAREVNMPKDTIQRAIDKGSGDTPSEALETIVYDAYVPGGIALLIHTVTDNKNRTAANVRSMVSRRGGQLASSGSVGYLFEKKGIIICDNPNDPETILSLAISAGADDVTVEDDGTVVVITTPDTFHPVLAEFDAATIAYSDACLDMIPHTQVAVSPEHMDGLLALLDALTDDDDVHDVFHNAIIPPESEALL